MQFHDTPHAQGPIDDRQIIGSNFKFIKQKTANTWRHGGIYRKIDHGAETPLAQSLLDAFYEQVACIVLSDFNIRIANHAKWIRFPDFKAWEKHAQMGSNDLLDPHKGRHFLPSYGKLHRHQTWDGRGNFHACK